MNETTGKLLATVATAIGFLPACAADGEPDWTALFRLELCGQGIHWYCPRSPASRRPDPPPEHDVVLSCHEPIGAGWIERVPVRISLDPSEPWIAYGPWLLAPGTPPAGDPPPAVVEQLEARVLVAKDRRSLAALQVASDGPELRAFDVTLDRAGGATIRRTRILRMSPMGTHGYGRELVLVDRWGLPTASFMDRQTPPGGRLARVVDAHREHIECERLEGGSAAYERAWLALLDESARYHPERPGARP